MNFAFRKGMTFLFVLLSLPFIGPTLSAQLGNPIMIIRCFNGESQLQSDDQSKTKNFQKTNEEECDEGEVYVEGLGCVTEAPCYDGQINVTVPMIDCNNLENGLALLTMCFQAAPGSPDIQVGDVVQLSTIQNCLDEFGNEWLDALAPDENFAFGPATEPGVICAEFYVDPTEPVVINFTNASEPVEVPTCPIIPSMGQWGLFILGLMLSSLAIVFIAVGRTVKA